MIKNCRGQDQTIEAPWRQTSLLCPAFVKPNHAQDILGNKAADGTGAVFRNEAQFHFRKKIIGVQ
jgi:hypothetical protein